MLRRRARGSTVLFRLSNAQLPWAEVTRRLRVDFPTALAAAAPGSARDAVRAPVGAVSPEVLSVLDAASTTLAELAPEHRTQARCLLDALRATAFPREVERALAERDGAWMAGFGHGRAAMGIHDDLEVRALAFRYNDVTTPATLRAVQRE